MDQGNFYHGWLSIPPRHADRKDLGLRLLCQSRRRACESARAPRWAQMANFSGHSLRSGFLTSAAARGASIFKMMDVSRHKSVDTLRGYVRDAEMFRDHAGDGLL